MPPAYTADRVELEAADQDRTEVTGRVDLFENLLAHRRDGVPLPGPPDQYWSVHAGAGRGRGRRAGPDRPPSHPMARRRPGPTRGGRGCRALAGEGSINRADFRRTRGALGPSRTGHGAGQARLSDAEVAVYRDGRGTIPTSTPRPYLHPVRTRAGVVVSAHHPADHDWHNGVGMVIPDVNGTNFWGGGTYVHGQGYLMLDDHGVIVGGSPDLDGDGFRQDLQWMGRDGSVQLREQRSIS